MSARDYAVLYVGGKVTRGGSVGGASILGGDAILDTEPHALTGPEHTGSLPWSFAQADGGLAGDGVTDDTAALQAWITSVTANGTRSGWFWFEEGTYLIAGALQDTGAFNGQILLPDVADANDGITLTFMGPARPQYNLSWGSGQPAPAGYTILKSTLTGASGTAAVISAGNTGATNNIQVNIINLICQLPNNPTATFWNIADTWNGVRFGLFITTDGMWTNTYVEPTNTNAYGIKLPKFNNSALGLEDIFVCQFYTGTKTGELNRGHLLAWLCAVGVEFPFSHHIGFSGSIQVGSCPIGMKVTGANQVVVEYDAEHAFVTTGGPNNPAWAVTTADLSDVSDDLTGEIKWWGVQAGVGVDHTFTLDGGANVQNFELGEAPGGLPSGAAGGDLSGTYPNPSVVNDSHTHTSATLPGVAGLLTVDPGTIAYNVAGADVVTTIASDWGYDADGPYYDDAGAASGEEALLALDPEVGDLVVIPYNP